ncbi:hypothetical protein BDA99DRAFT_532764 [Phascolomyces articulosus]|uniref:Fe2OG dioxygenase domain-containing protein n=1 Tax=Phascolomyces articulosus TaxID=60185 RepID=A0AAD5PIT1_9FUNG|nr:hypothetical protein BDA99DRAFT_532764 [Phascolomyces articulosus]
MTPHPDIPVIDFSDFTNRSSLIANQVLEACTRIGFFYIKNHQIPKDMIQNAFSLSKRFFDLPLKTKQTTPIQYNRGYIGLFVQRGFNIGPIIHGEYNHPLPKVFDESKDQMEDFFRACHATIVQVLEAFAIALEIPEEEGGREWFSKCHNYEDVTSGETIRYMKYPRGGESTYKEPVRAGAHSDFGTVTLLFQKDISGLEIQANRTEWISAPIIEDAILVNVGDLLQQWSNGLLLSTKHRVVFKPEHEDNDRYSIACFAQPKRSTPLNPIPSHLVPKKLPVLPKELPDHLREKVITAGDYLQFCLDTAYAQSKKLQETTE